jgi:hypothetical protein
MPVDATPTSYFQFPTIFNNSVLDTWVCDMGVILAQFNADPAVVFSNRRQKYAQFLR